MRAPQQQGTLSRPVTAHTGAAVRGGEEGLFWGPLSRGRPPLCSSSLVHMSIRHSGCATPGYAVLLPGCTAGARGWLQKKI